MAPNYFKDVPVAGLSGYARLEELINQHKAEMDEKIACQHEYITNLYVFLKTEFPAWYEPLADTHAEYERRMIAIHNKFNDNP